MGRAVAVSILVAIGISIATVGVILERSKLTHELSMMAMTKKYDCHQRPLYQFRISFRVWDRPLSFLLDRLLYIVLGRLLSRDKPFLIWNLESLLKVLNEENEKVIEPNDTDFVVTGMKHNRFFRVMFCYVLCQKKFYSVMLCSVMWKSKFFVLCYVMCYDFDFCPWTRHIHGHP